MHGWMLVLLAHEWSWRRVLALFFVGVAAGVSQHVMLPSVGPLGEGTRSLETLGTVMGLLLVAALCRSLTSRVTHYEATRSRHLVGARMLLLGVASLACVGVATVVAVTGPVELEAVDVIRTYTLLTAVGLATAALVGETWGVLAVIALVGASSVRGLWPWRANLLFNPDTVGYAWFVIGAATLILLMWAAAGHYRLIGLAVVLDGGREL